ncbi:MAG: ATP-binding protein [Halioglobus sp.]
MTSIVVLVAAINLATLKSLTDIGREEKLQQLDEGIQAYQRFDAQRRELFVLQAQTLADNPFLKASLTTVEIDPTLVDSNLSQLRTSESVSALLAFDARLELLAVKPTESYAMMNKMTAKILAKTLQGHTFYGASEIDSQFFQLAAAPIQSGGQFAGVLAVAQRIDTPAQLDAISQVSGFEVVLSFVDRMVPSSQRFEDSLIERLLIGFSSVRSNVKRDSSGVEVREVAVDGRAFFVSAVPIGESGQLLFYAPADLLPSTLDRLRQVMLLGSALGLFLGICFSTWIALRVSGPIRKVTDAAEKFRSGALDTRVDITTRDEMGQLAGSFNHMVDQFVTEQAELIASKEAAEAASQAKSTFLATMSHEIRTPLNGVLGMTEIVSSTLRGTEHQRNLDIIRDSGNSLLEVINDILDFSKIEAGKLELSFSEFEFRRFLSDLCDNQSPSARAKGLDLTSSLPPQIAFKVEADLARLRRVLTNLIGNAIKFTTTGHVDLSVKLLHKRPGFATFRFEVSDTGIGIASGRIEQIFESFTQADGSTTRQFGGTGLGLAISKQLVELMGGEIQVSSVPGRGSCFSFDLELKAEQIRESSRQERPDHAGDSSQSFDPLPGENLSRSDTPGHAIHSGSRVLLVEDAVVNQEVAQAMISWYGCEVTIAGNGRKALETMEGESFDLIFMDCQMPYMDGFEATGEIRRIEEAEGLARIPIVALTANAVQGDRERCLDAGMDDYISKPFTNEIIAEKLGRWLPPATLTES